LVCHFWGFVNMLTFIDLRPDDPLLLTLLEHAYPSALTSSYIARLTSARTIFAPLIRHNRPVPETRFCSNFSPSTVAPSTSESTWRLTPARAWLREFQLHAEKQLMPAVENQCANLNGSTEFDSREWQLLCRSNRRLSNQRNMRLSKSHAVGGFRQRNSKKGSYFGSAGTRWGACSRTSLGKSDQIKSDQIRRSTSCLRAEER